MKYIFFFFILITITSCNKTTNDITKFKTGTFKTFLDNSDKTSTAIRNDSIQIETYNNVKDTFAIEWKSNFEYILLKVNPKSALDSTPFYVKITGFKENSYTFTAHYKGSNFKQLGNAVKLK